MSSSGKSYGDAERARDNIKRGIKETSYAGTATFFGARLADPFLQYGILGGGLANNLIARLGGRVLPQGPGGQRPIKSLTARTHTFIVATARRIRTGCRC